MRDSALCRTFKIPRRSQKFGFTVWDLLAILAVLLLLLTFLLPAIQTIPPSSRRINCVSNLHNIGLALLAFEARNRALPPGLPNCKTTNLYQVEDSNKADCQGPNWQTAILPDIEEGKAFQDILLCLDDPAIENVCNDCPEVTQSQVGTKTPPVLVCPSSTSAGSEFLFTKYGVPTDTSKADIKLSKGSYAACFGAESYLSSHTQPELAGVFEVVPIPTPAQYVNRRWMLASNKGTRLNQITDGTSKTIMVSEILGIASEADARGVWTWPGMGGSTFTGYNRPNATARDVLPICETNSNFYAGSSSSLICQTERRTSGPNAPLVHAAARSNHDRTVNVVLADGSGHSITNDIDPKLWQALCTRAGPMEQRNAAIPK